MPAGSMELVLPVEGAEELRPLRRSPVGLHPDCHVQESLGDCGGDCLPLAPPAEKMRCGYVRGRLPQHCSAPVCVLRGCAHYSVPQ